MRRAVLSLLLLRLLPLFADDPRPAPSSDPRIEEAVRKGVACLVSARDEEGFWRNDGVESCPVEGYSVAGTAVACLALLEARDLAVDDSAEPALTGGAEWLVEWGLKVGERGVWDREV